MANALITELARQNGMGRAGGMMSQNSTPIKKDKGSNFAAMENALAKKGFKSPKQAAQGKSGGQFAASKGAPTSGSFSGNPHRLTQRKSSLY